MMMEDGSMKMVCPTPTEFRPGEQTGGTQNKQRTNMDVPPLIPPPPPPGFQIPRDSLNNRKEKTAPPELNNNSDIVRVINNDLLMDDEAKAGNEAKAVAHCQQGFSNFGNSCYMNAVLQSLLGLKSFVVDLLMFYKHHQKVFNNKSMTRALARLMLARHRHQLQGESSGDMNPFLKDVQMAASVASLNFTDYRQHDAHEFLSQVLVMLKEEGMALNGYAQGYEASRGQSSEQSEECQESVGEEAESSKTSQEGKEESSGEYDETDSVSGKDNLNPNGKGSASEQERKVNTPQKSGDKSNAETAKVQEAQSVDSSPRNIGEDADPGADISGDSNHNGTRSIFGESDPKETQISSALTSEDMARIYKNDSLFENTEVNTKNTITWSAYKVDSTVEKAIPIQYQCPAIEITIKSGSNTAHHSNIVNTGNSKTARDKKEVTWGDFVCSKDEVISTKNKGKSQKLNTKGESVPSKEKTESNNNQENTKVAPGNCSDDSKSELSTANESRTTSVDYRSEESFSEVDGVDETTGDGSVLSTDNIKDKSSVLSSGPCNPTCENFEFDLVQTTDCLSCYRSKQTTERHTYLIVDIPEDRPWPTLQDAVDDFFKKEELDYTCEHCKESTKAEIGRKFCRLPRILILYLKRYDARNVKSDDTVQVPPYITVQKHCDGIVMPPASYQMDWPSPVQCLPSYPESAKDFSRIRSVLQKAFATLYIGTEHYGRGLYKVFEKDENREEHTNKKKLRRNLSEAFDDSQQPSPAFEDICKSVGEKGDHMYNIPTPKVESSEEASQIDLNHNESKASKDRQNVMQRQAMTDYHSYVDKDGNINASELSEDEQLALALALSEERIPFSDENHPVDMSASNLNARPNATNDTVVPEQDGDDNNNAYRGESSASSKRTGLQSYEIDPDLRQELDNFVDQTYGLSRTQEKKRDAANPGKGDDGESATEEDEDPLTEDEGVAPKYQETKTTDRYTAEVLLPVNQQKEDKRHSKDKHETGATGADAEVTDCQKMKSAHHDASIAATVPAMSDQGEHVDAEKAASMTDSGGEERHDGSGCEVGMEVDADSFNTDKKNDSEMDVDHEEAVWAADSPPGAIRGDKDKAFQEEEKWEDLNYSNMSEEDQLRLAISRSLEGFEGSASVPDSPEKPTSPGSQGLLPSEMIMDSSQNMDQPVRESWSAHKEPWIMADQAQPVTPQEEYLGQCPSVGDSTSDAMQTAQNSQCKKPPDSSTVGDTALGSNVSSPHTDISVKTAEKKETLQIDGNKVEKISVSGPKHGTSKDSGSNSSEADSDSHSRKTKRRLNTIPELHRQSDNEENEEKDNICPPTDDDSDSRKPDRSLGTTPESYGGSGNEENKEKNDFNPPTEDKAHSYKLVSVVNHKGESSLAGHYFSDVLDMETDRWFTFDDKWVEETKEADVRRTRVETGYIFFYISQDTYEAIQQQAKTKKQQMKNVRSERAEAGAAQEQALPVKEDWFDTVATGGSRTSFAIKRSV